MYTCLSIPKLVYALLNCSLYNLIDVVMLLVSQYSMILSMSSTLFKFSKPPFDSDLQSLLVQVENFSRIYAARPIGESFRATPKLIKLSTIKYIYYTNI